MIEENPANLILLAPFQPVEGKCEFAFENRRAFTPDPVSHPATAVLVIVNLAAGALKKAVVIKQLQTTEHLLGAAGKKCAEMIGTQKPMAMNVFEDPPVAFGQTERGDFL
jgi:hypothetical protein